MERRYMICIAATDQDLMDQKEEGSDELKKSMPIDFLNLMSGMLSISPDDDVARSKLISRIQRHLMHLAKFNNIQGPNSNRIPPSNLVHRLADMSCQQCLSALVCILDF